MSYTKQRACLEKIWQGVSETAKYDLNYLRLSFGMGFRGGSVVKNLPAMQEMLVWSLRWEDSLEKRRATHSSLLAWRIPFVLLWLAYLLSIMSSRFICVIACVRVPLISFFFLRLSNIPLYVYIIFCLSIHHLMHVCVASIFQLLWRMLLWTWVYKNLSPCFQFYSDFPLFFSWFSHGKLCVSRNWFISSSLSNLFTYNCS